MIVFLALLLALASFGVSLVLAVRLRALNERLALIERAPKRVPLEGAEGGSALRSGRLWEKGFAGLRITLEICQDHPHPIFATLLKESLQREDAIVGDPSDVRIEGEIVGNGYTDVYFRAELTAWVGDEVLFTLSDKPPHGDRPANLAAEVVQRLKDETAKRERWSAIRELGPS